MALLIVSGKRRNCEQNVPGTYGDTGVYDLLQCTLCLVFALRMRIQFGGFLLHYWVFWWNARNFANILESWHLSQPKKEY